MTCLDDDAVLGLVDGRLAAAQVAAADEHLDACDGCRELVAYLARERSGAGALVAGTRVGRYEIERAIGEGAMGRVYAAREPELDRVVALKVLRDARAGARARIVREAQAMARLDHPNVIGVFEVGAIDPGDAVFVAMELVDGETLRAWARGAHPWRARLAVLADVARGLAAAHGAGIVHRDVKPDNVIVGADGRARLGDFGLAAAAGASLANGTPVVAGTPAYMAPELARGAAGTGTPERSHGAPDLARGAPANEATDQFALGVTAYEVLAGRRPSSPPSPLRGVPRAVDAAVRRCLAPDPVDRHASVAAVAEVFARLASPRRRAPWIAAALGAAALASAATWLAVRDSHAPAPACDAAASQIAALRADALPDPARAALASWTAALVAERDETCRAAPRVPPARTAARDRCLDERTNEVAALIARATPAPTNHAAAPTAAAPTESARTESTAAADKLVDALAALPPAECRAADATIADPLPLDPVRVAALRAIRAALPGLRATIAIGDPREAVAPAAALVDRAIAAGHAPTLAAAQLSYADALRGAGRLAEAALAARDALAAAERGRDDLAATQAWLARVAVAGEQRDLAAAEDLAAVAAAALDRADAPPRLAAILLEQRGLVAYNRGALADAHHFLADARAKLAAVSGERSTDVAAAESALGTVARASGDLASAEAHHRAALALDRALRGPAHADVARDLHNLAGVLRLRGALADALATYRDALALEIATHGADSAEAGLTHNSIGLVLMARRDWPAARTELAAARDALAAAHHADLAFAEHNLGLVAAATGDPRGALAHYQTAAALYAATIGGAAEPAQRLALDRARAELAAGDARAARAHAREAAASPIAWIATDAAALTTPPRAIAQPQRAAEPALPTVPAPAPRPDVGVYGASQRW